MRKLNGGYVMIDLNDTNNIYSRAKNAIGCGKPIMVYDDPECYYADSISLNGDGDVVIVKGGKSITINDANAVSSEGVIIPNIMENIVDANGNKRFIEVNATNESVTEGTTITYAKASLSGTHLMLVVAGSIANGTEFDNLQESFTLPSWIMDKITPVWSKYIESKTITAYDDYWVNQTFNVALEKYSDTQLRILKTGAAVTLTADRNFRVQFDLLIDAE